MQTISADVLKIDPRAVSNEIENSIRESVLIRLRRRGAVIGISGGIDSSVTAAICAKALGSDRVFGILMPEQDSSPESSELGRRLAEKFGIQYTVEDIAPTLQALGCYERRDDAIRKVIPEYGPGWKSKIVLPGVADGQKYSIFSVVAQSAAGEMKRVRLTTEAYLGIVAATNFKQRTRKMLEYYHADRLWYAVAGTPNRLEYAQGFFVKNGDGAADFKPIAHLYKSQVYQLGEYLGVPDEILRRPPTTDTYSLEQSQEEFYFSVPLEILDLCLYGKNNQMSVDEIAKISGPPIEQVRSVYSNIESKILASKYLHLPPQLVQEVNEVKDSLE
jgi:NAD+ synthase